MKAVEAGGIEVVVKAINTHINNAGVCYQGCDTLRNMTEINGKSTDKIKQANKQIKWTAENRVKAGEAGVIETVVKVISTHINNAGMCKQGCRALLGMIKDNSKNQQPMK